MAPDPSTQPHLTFEITKTGETLVVKLHGRLVAEGRDQLYDEVRRLIPDNKRIVLDLCHLTHMDSMGLGTLVRLLVSARSAGCTLELMNLSKGIYKLLNLTKMMTVFSVVGENGIKMG